MASKQQPSTDQDSGPGPTGPADVHPWGRWTSVAVTALTTLAFGAVLVAGAQPAYAASASDCVNDTSGATVHYLVDFSTAPGPAISGLTITGFDQSACDGLPVRLVISGNSAGDPALNGNAAVMHTLSTLDSSVAPCPAAPKSVISGGSITLRGCAGALDPSSAAYASLHDATQLTLSVDGKTIPVVVGPIAPPPTQSPSPSPSPSPSTSSPAPSSSASGSVDATSAHRPPPSNGPSSSQAVGGTQAHRGGGSLAFTGVQVATLAGVAALLILLGLLIVLAGRRRDRGHTH